MGCPMDLRRGRGASKGGSISPILCSLTAPRSVPKTGRSGAEPFIPQPTDPTPAPVRKEARANNELKEAAVAAPDRKRGPDSANTDSRRSPHHLGELQPAVPPVAMPRAGLGGGMLGHHAPGPSASCPPHWGFSSVTDGKKTSFNTHGAEAGGAEMGVFPPLIGGGVFLVFPAFGGSLGCTSAISPPENFGKVPFIFFFSPLAVKMWLLAARACGRALRGGTRWGPGPQRNTARRARWATR